MRANPEELYALGVICLKGVGRRQNVEEAFQCLEEAANAGYANALLLLGILYNRGTYVNQDKTKALQYFRKAFKKFNRNGSAAAVYSLGLMYYYGQGVKENYKTAYECFSVALSKGIEWALPLLGEMYHFGKGVEQDTVLALAYLKEAKSKKIIHPSTFFLLGKIYYLKQNYFKAKNYFELSIKMGLEIKNSSHLLGHIHYRGLGTNLDYQKAFTYFQQANLRGHHESNYFLGEMYYLGKGIELNFKKAKEYFQKAITFFPNCTNGYLQASYYLGKIHYEDKDFDIAYKYFTDVVVYNCPNAPDAQYYLGMIDLSVIHDNESAKRSFAQAAKRGHTKSMVILGLMLGTKVGDMAQFPSHSLKLIERAAEKGDKDGLIYLGLFYFDVFGINRSIKQNLVKGFECFMSAAEKQDAYGYYFVALAYYKGLGVNKNIIKASYYWRKALETLPLKEELPLSIPSLCTPKQQIKIETIESLLNIFDEDENNYDVAYHVALGLTADCNTPSYHKLATNVINKIFLTNTQIFIQFLQQEDNENVRRALSLLDIKFRQQLALRIKVAINCLAQIDILNWGGLPDELIRLILGFCFGEKLIAQVLDNSLLLDELLPERVAYWQVKKLEEAIAHSTKELAHTSLLGNMWTSLFGKTIPITMYKKLNDSQLKKVVINMGSRELEYIESGHRQEISYQEAMSFFKQARAESYSSKPLLTLDLMV